MDGLLQSSNDERFVHVCLDRTTNDLPRVKIHEYCHINELRLQGLDLMQDLASGGLERGSQRSVDSFDVRTELLKFRFQDML